MQPNLSGCALLAVLLLTPPIRSVETVPIGQVVTPCMGDNLELAITPTPQEAKLSDRMLVAGSLEIVTTKDYRQPATLKDASRWVDSLGVKDGKAVKVLLGELGDGGPADRALQALRLAGRRAADRPALGPRRHVQGGARRRQLDAGGRHPAG